MKHERPRFRLEHLKAGTSNPGISKEHESQTLGLKSSKIGDNKSGILREYSTQTIVEDVSYNKLCKHNGCDCGY